MTEPPVVVEEPPPSGGLSFVLLDIQTRETREGRTRFVRAVVRVATELGSRAAGQRRFEFVPPYEKLVLHALEIRRGSARLQQLDPSRLRILERETGLDASVYSGARTAVIEMTDVRVGDLIQYEYSIVGANPVLAGHVMDHWLLGVPSGAGALQYRTLSDHPLLASPMGEASPPIRKRFGGLYEYTASALPLTPVVVDSNLPEDYEPFPAIQLTDFSSWSEVARWGTDLFRIEPGQSQGVEALAARIRYDYKVDAGRVLGALRVVQDTIRYVSASFAENTHRPAQPGVVLARRFGDCKDKSLLLVALLQALGFKANVALVNSRRGQALPSTLPTVQLFDHAIVVVELEKRRYWLDPTRLYQRGSLAEVAPRDLHFALILDDTATDLTFVARRPGSTRIWRPIWTTASSGSAGPRSSS